MKKQAMLDYQFPLNFQIYICLKQLFILINTDADSHNLSKWVKKDSNWRYVKNTHSDNLFAYI